MPTKLQLRATVFGDLPEFMKEETARGASAVSRGIDVTTISLKAALRAQITAAFGSQRLANTWQSEEFPKLPKTSLGAASVVYSKAPHIIEAFEQATVIKSAKGFWLAIPSPDCPKGPGGSRLTPSTFPEDRFGKLRFVYRQGKSSLLVVDQVRRGTGKRGGIRKGTAAAIKKGTTETIVMFFLVPQVRLSKRIDPQSAYAKAEDDLLNNVIAAWSE